MRFATLAVLVGIALIATSVPGVCSGGSRLEFGITARALAMGVTGTGIADDAAAWHFNPAGLPDMNVTPKGDSEVPWSLIVGAGSPSDAFFDEDVWHIGTGDGEQGFAGGRIRSDDNMVSFGGVGYGRRVNNVWSLGCSAIMSSCGGCSAIMSSNASMFLNVGAMGTWYPGWGHGGPTRLGLVIQDVTEENPTANGERTPIFNLGFSTHVGNSLLLAADWSDFTDETEVIGSPNSGSFFKAGAELSVWNDRVDLRVGSHDGDLSYGVGVELADDLRVDAGFLEVEVETYLDGARSASTLSETEFDKFLITVTKGL